VDKIGRVIWLQLQSLSHRHTLSTLLRVFLEHKVVQT
jgi:hypothetical protein